MQQNVPIYRKKDGIYRFYFDSMNRKYIEYNENGKPPPPHIVVTMLTKLEHIDKYPSIKSYTLIDEFEESSNVVTPVSDEEIKNFDPKAFQELKQLGQINPSDQKQQANEIKVYDNVLSNMLPSIADMFFNKKQDIGLSQNKKTEVSSKFLTLIKDYSKLKSKKEKEMKKIEIESFVNAINMIDEDLIKDVVNLMEIIR